tara:strand:+ start:12711 stop:14384 length:1674 start_codon:yes stop_codon:yes gene_type:complete
MAIEILENTLLKLLVRRGTNADRKKITLASGELGYTTDTERLYIGNGSDMGGILVGNKWKGYTSDLTSLAGVITGDYAFDTSTNTLNVLTKGDGSSSDNWYTVANQLSAGNDTIQISTNAGITVGTLSAGNFSADTLGSSLELDGSSRIALSGTVNIDAVSIRDTNATSYLTLPPRLKINTVGYAFPATSPTNNTFLKSNANGVLNWAPYQVIETAVSPTTASVLPVASIVPFASGSDYVPYGWLPCDGSEYISTSYPDLSAVIGTSYNIGGETSADYFRVPNLINKTLYGSPNELLQNSTLMGVLTGLSTTSVLSAVGMNYIIKSVGGVTNPTLTVQKNLSAFVNGVDQEGVAFNPLSGKIIIERPPPGMVTYNSSDGDEASSDNSYSFTTPAGVTYMKYHVTGTGANGGHNNGGAAATVIGNISAAPGTVFTVYVGEAPTSSNQNGRGSCIMVGANCIAASYGGRYAAAGDTQPTEHGHGAPGEGYIGTGEPQFLNGYIFRGGKGGVDTSDSDEESAGASSYWGTAPAPGAGSASENKTKRSGPVSDGFVMFEWN